GEAGLPRIEVLTRLRHDARLYAVPPAQRPKGQRGRAPKWGPRLAKPSEGGGGPSGGQTGKAVLYGRVRAGGAKEGPCVWRGAWARRCSPASRATKTPSPWSAAPRT